MFINNKIVIILVLIFFIILSVHTSNAYADAANISPGGIIVVQAITNTCLGLGLLGFLHLFKKNDVEKVPVTSVLFDKESVDLKIDGNKMEVDTRFEYQNTTDKYLQMDLFFPFSRPIHSSIDDISILLGRQYSMHEGEKYVPLKYDFYSPTKISFNFVLRPMERAVLKVHYLENLFENKAEYIVTTIKTWKLPVAQAVFTVQLPSNKKSPVFSFEDGLVEKIHMEAFDLYKFQFLNLYPDKEFQVVWND